MTDTVPFEPLRFEYDAVTDVITIEGVKYAGIVFRKLLLCEPGTWLRIEEKKGRNDICV